MVEKIKLLLAKIVAYLGSKGYFRWMDDETYLKLYYKAIFGKSLDIQNPKTFNEKLQWLKIHDRKLEYVSLVDKFLVKKIVEDKLGKEYVIPTLGCWDSFNEINFEELPDQFVLKCTHDSGGIVICKNKKEFNYTTAKNKIEHCLKKNFYWVGREWPYKEVKPKIIAEKYMVDEVSKDLQDYKFMCFNGVVKCTFVCNERFSESGVTITIFDRNWNVMPVSRRGPRSKKKIKKPVNYEKMIQLAEQLSKGMPFLRVDFYEINNKIYFGEITFYPGSGFEKFYPDLWDLKLGEWISLEDV